MGSAGEGLEGLEGLEGAEVLIWSQTNMFKFEISRGGSVTEDRKKERWRQSRGGERQNGGGFV